MKFQSKFISIHSRKSIWKCRLRNGVHLSRPQCVKSRCSLSQQDFKSSSANLLWQRRNRAIIPGLFLAFWWVVWWICWIDILVPEQNKLIDAGYMLKRIVLKEIYCIWFWFISNLYPKTNWMMIQRWLTEQVMRYWQQWWHSLLTHISATRPHWIFKI